MDVPDKVNGDLTNETNDLPKSQRRLKINRRSYHLANSPTSCLSTDKSDEKDSSINGSDGTVDKLSKADTTQKRIISLSSIKNSGRSLDKNNSAKAKDSSSVIILKKTPITFTVDKKENPINTVTSSSSDPPPKKKHKPITWP